MNAFGRLAKIILFLALMGSTGTLGAGLSDYERRNDPYLDEVHKVLGYINWSALQALAKKSPIDKYKLHNIAIPFEYSAYRRDQLHEALRKAEKAAKGPRQFELYRAIDDLCEVVLGEHRSRVRKQVKKVEDLLDEYKDPEMFEEHTLSK
ncbi:MAG: hypothetical protein AAGK14_00595 [Verrucomicrobiota bacterium]